MENTPVSIKSNMKQPLIWHNVLFMFLTPLAALIWTPLYIHWHGFSWGLLAFLIVTYTISNMVITCGYHRYFSHRSYNVHPIIEILYIFVGAGSFQGSVLSWCTDHRRHHREVDSNDDPYSIKKGFWFAHLTWMFREDPYPQAKDYPADLTRNRLIVWQHKYYALVATFIGFILPGLIGWALGFGFWGGLIIGGALRITLSQHSTFLINSAAHMFGIQPYSDKNTARDSFIMAFLTFGEGYHNYHHFFQADYRNGIRWYHWDPTKWFIRGLQLTGLATKLKKARREEVFKARLAMDERFMISRGACTERVNQLKESIFDAQMRIKKLHEDYLLAKANFKLRRREVSLGRLLQQTAKMKQAEVKIAKIQFAAACTQWRTFRRAVAAAA